MLDPATNLLPPSSSPTTSSISSSDLDTESTGSFFHDRSTTLGTLMGVTFRAPSLRRQPSAAQPSTVAGLVAVEERRRRRWWLLCGDEEDDEARRTRASLGEFLEVERRFGDVATIRRFEGGGTQGRSEGVLFAEGRVLPPVRAEESPETGVLCRFPVSIIGICSCGA